MNPQQQQRKWGEVSLLISVKVAFVYINGAKKRIQIQQRVTADTRKITVLTPSRCMRDMTHYSCMNVSMYSVSRELIVAQ